MAVSIDASTPAFSTATGGTNFSDLTTNGDAITQTSASFSPPAGSLVVVEVLANYEGQPGYTSTGLSVKDSLSNTYNTSSASVATGASGVTGIEIFWYYYVSSESSITVSATLAAAQSYTSGTCLCICPLVLDGAGSTQSGGAFVAAQLGTSTGTVEDSITPTVIGSLPVVIGANGAGTTMTAESGTTTKGQGSPDPSTNSSAYGYATNSTSSLTSTSFGWTTGSSISAIAILEILPPAAAGPAASPGRQLPNPVAYQVFAAGPAGKGHSI